MAMIPKSGAFPSTEEKVATTKVFPNKILIVVEESDQSIHTARYVGSLLRDTKDVGVTLFHVLKPMPRELMEHGGSEDPEMEDRLGVQLRKDQEDWVRTESAIEYPILLKVL